MRPRHFTLPFLGILFVLGWMCAQGVLSPEAPAEAGQAPGQTPATPGASATIRKESNLVLVDVIATDKHGNYLRDLEAKDFRVYEDNKEQAITSLTRGSENAAPQGPSARRYLVLFFDNSTMSFADQANARKAALQFIDKTASPDRVMAVVDYGGTLRIAQNFTADTDRLKRVVQGTKFSAVNPNATETGTEVASLGAPPLTNAEADFGARDMLLGIRALAKNLRTVPGRKTLILFSSGFPLNADQIQMSELTAAIDACNKANVAIYPVDARGLATMMPDLQSPSPRSFFERRSGWNFSWASLLTVRQSTWTGSGLSLLGTFLWTPAELPQRPPAGEGGGGPTGPRGGPGGTGGTGRGGPTGSTGGPGVTGGSGRGGTGGTSGTGGTGGTRGGTGGTGGTRGPVGSSGAPGGITRMPLANQPRVLLPPIPKSPSANQDVLYMLASGTGGFPILNTNDLASGLDKIARELNEYYVLSYVPPATDQEGACHTIRVKLERGGTHVRARSGYCDIKGPDILAGKPEEKILEARAAAPQPGNVPVTLEAPFFYTAPGTARVNLAMSMPADTLSFEKEKGKFHSTVNVLGIAYRRDGSVAARFSDAVKLDLEKGEMKELEKGPFNYQNTFDIAPGEYRLDVVMSTGSEKFAKYETPLIVEPYDGKQFGLSGVTLSSEIQRVSEATTSLDAALMEERMPLVVNGLQLIPSATNRFTGKDKVAFYVEVYEPLLLSAKSPQVAVVYNVFEQKTGRMVFTSGGVPVNSFAESGNPIIPVGLKLPVASRPGGEYRLEVHAQDSGGNFTPVRTTTFEVK